MERFGRALFEHALFERSRFKRSRFERSRFKSSRFERASEDTQGFTSIGFDHPEPARRIDRISGQD
jgi:hypothetical protein